MTTAAKPLRLAVSERPGELLSDRFVISPGREATVPAEAVEFAQRSGDRIVGGLLTEIVEVGADGVRQRVRPAIGFGVGTSE